jgi:hypothetical protein
VKCKIAKSPFGYATLSWQEAAARVLPHSLLPRPRALNTRHILPLPSFLPAANYKDAWMPKSIFGFAPGAAAIVHKKKKKKKWLALAPSSRSSSSSSETSFTSRLKLLLHDVCPNNNMHVTLGIVCRVQRQERSCKRINRLADVAPLERNATSIRE